MSLVLINYKHMCSFQQLDFMRHIHSKGPNRVKVSQHLLILLLFAWLSTHFTFFSNTVSYTFCKLAYIYVSYIYDFQALLKLVFWDNLVPWTK